MANNEEIINKYKTFIGDQSLERAGNDIPEYMLHSKKNKTNFFFGIKYGIESDGTNAYRYIGKPQDRDGHILVIGGAGSGKSSCVAIPTLATWSGTIFAIDIKGELTEKWLNVSHPKRPVKIFSFEKKTGINSRYDPFYLLREGSEDDLVQNAREIAQAIIPLPHNVQEPFWTQAAQHVLTAVILYNSDLKTVNDDGITLESSFNKTMTMIQTTPLWKLIEEIGKSKNEAAIMHINQFCGIENPEDNKMLAGISAELSNRVMVFATDMRIKNAFSRTDDMMKWENLETHNIFMKIAEDKLGQWDGAITLMLTQLIRTLERRPDIYSAEGKSKNLPPVLLLLDEFPRLGKVDVIQNAVSTLRSKGVTICLMMQSLTQLDKTYGKESRQIIVDNCQYKAILNVTDPDNQKIFSDMIGTINVSKHSIGDGFSENTGKSSGDNIGETFSWSSGKTRGVTKNTSLNISVSREPIIHPHEFATLKDIVLMTPEGFCRVRKKPYYCHIIVGADDK